MPLLIARRRLILAGLATPFATPAVHAACADPDPPRGTLRLLTRIPIDLGTDPNPRFVVEANPPPADFDPLVANPAQLDAHKIPPRPYAGSSAEHGWIAAMTGSKGKFWPVEVCPFPDTTAACGTFRPLGLFPIPPPSTPSQNWSGAYVRATELSRFTTVQGSWDVPRIAVPDPPDSRGRLSAWLGLDGLDPGSLSMPQIGTASGYKKRTGETYEFAWWQWWVKNARIDDAREIPKIENFPVRTGDRVIALVHVLANRQGVLFFLRNLEPRRDAAIAFSVTTECYPGDMPPLAVEGQSAAWIIERPTIRAREPGETGRFFTFPPNYGTTTFRQALAATDETSSQPVEHDLQRARLLRLTDWDDAAMPGQVLSSAELVGDDRVELHYGP